jgi:hypothetical protein
MEAPNHAQASDTAFTLSDFSAHGRKCCLSRGKRLIKAMVYAALSYDKLFNHVNSRSLRRFDFPIKVDKNANQRVLLYTCKKWPRQLFCEFELLRKSFFFL